MSFKQIIKTAVPFVGAVALIVSMPASADGEKTYKKACKMCHGSGMMGAPKTGDAAAWADRVAKGKDALYASAINGIGKMKPKGGKKSLSDDDVKAAVDYMVDHSK
ncbi:c-type cytochrome [Pseudomonadota bacterium]